VRANRVDERDKAIVSHVEFPTQGIGDFVWHSRYVLTIDACITWQ
jgi:hypothetical protein